MIEYPINHLVPKGPRPYSPVTKVGDLLFVSGQGPTDAAGDLVHGTFAEEFARTMENLRRILEMAGSDLSHVVQVRGYVNDPADLPLYNQLYRDYFTEPYPSRTTLTGCLPNFLFEIDCIAVVAPTEG
ncbi:MAG: RidA family protein [Armatimonadota bacterium]